MQDRNLQNLVVKYAQQIITSLESAPEVILHLTGRGMAVTWVNWIEYLCSEKPIPPPTWLAKGILYAEVVQSRWIVRCPTCGPGIGSLASKHDRRFWCVVCQNYANNRQPYNVIFPRRPDLIEVALMFRPLAHQRNWKPGESMKQLAAENIAHGCTERMVNL